MSRGSPALTAARKEEIIEACARLYETMSFKEITIKEIGAATSFTRTSIYNYFETKEEIFLALLQREYELWVDVMNAVMADRASMANSRPERLAEFKVAYGASLDAVTRMVKKYIPEMNEAGRQQFLYAFFPFIYGIYPYTSVTEKQKAAMAQAEIPYVYQSAYDLTYTCLKKLLNAKET